MQAVRVGACALLVSVSLSGVGPTRAEPRVDANVIFGMYSGLALLMDVYYPETPAGYGVVLIPGSGWSASLGYNAQPLKNTGGFKVLIPPLTGAGYTVFVIGHRAAPRFRYPAAVEDAQRAVRFVRHHAERFRIRPSRIGGVGHSSGAHLVSLLGVLEGTGDPADPDPVNRQSAKVQCVVASSAPTDLARLTVDPASPLDLFFGFLPAAGANAYRDASPITHVSAADAALLLLHGDADSVVPMEQAERMEAAMRQRGVAVKLLRIQGGGHGFVSQRQTGWPDFLGEMVQWLDRHLKE